MDLIDRFLASVYRIEECTSYDNLEGAYITDGVVWVISKRRWLFFRKILTYTKILRGNHPNTAAVQYEDAILTFPTEETAEDEIDRICFGQDQITKRVWQNGKIVEEYRDK